MHLHSTKRHQENHAQQGPSSSSDGSRGVALRPPTYGIDLADGHEDASFETHERSAQFPPGVASPRIRSMPRVGLQRACACGGSGGSGGTCATCQGKKKSKEKKTLRRAPTGRGRPPSVPPSVFEVLRSPGQPLDAGTRSWFEPRIGHDLGRVRVHTDAAAAASAGAVQARAYTVGQHAVFASGQYATRSSAGRKLLAHELVHTVQQRGVSDRPPSTLAIGPPGDAHEREADRIADKVLRSPAPSASPAPPVSNRPSASPVASSSPALSASPVAAPSPVRSTSRALQRVCGPVAIGTPAGCDPFGSVSTDQIFSVPTERFLFRVNCDDFDSVAEQKRPCIPSTIPFFGAGFFFAPFFRPAGLL